MENHQLIPDLEVNLTDKLTFTLTKWSEYLAGKYLVLFFYPRNNTPGCTAENQEFASLYDKFKAKEVAVIGVSRDTLASHIKFKEKLNLPFPLLADDQEILCNELTLIKQKNMYGKQVRGIERSTLIIDNQGKIIKYWRKVKAEGHAANVLAFFNS